MSQNLSHLLVHLYSVIYIKMFLLILILYFCLLQETFARAKTWVKELQRQASPSIVIALAGNKSDLSAKRMVDHDEAYTYAEENGLLFMETSAKTAMNVTDIFLAIGM